MAYARGDLQRPAGQVRSLGEILEGALKERNFDGSDAVMIFDLLGSSIRERKFAAMSKAQWHLTPGRMLNMTAHDQFFAIRDCSVAE